MLGLADVVVCTGRDPTVSTILYTRPRVAGAGRTMFPTKVTLVHLASSCSRAIAILSGLTAEDGDGVMLEITARSVAID